MYKQYKMKIASTVTATCPTSSKFQVGMYLCVVQKTSAVKKAMNNVANPQLNWIGMHSL